MSALTLPGMAPKPARAADKLKTNARIVIIGAGAAGLHLDYAAIEGMDVGRIGLYGLGGVYAGPAARRRR